MDDERPRGDQVRQTEAIEKKNTVNDDVTHISFCGESQFKKYTDRNKNGKDGCKHSKAM